MAKKKYPTQEERMWKMLNRFGVYTVEDLMSRPKEDFEINIGMFICPIPGKGGRNETPRA